MKKHSRKIEFTDGKIFLLLCFLIFFGCEEEKKPSGYLAKVEDTYLYRDDFPSYFDSSTISKKHLSELIRSWVNTEILYREALREGIFDDDEFKKIFENSKREIASGIFLKKLEEKIEINIADDETEKFFNENKPRFGFTGNAYLLNYAVFRSFDKSALFRNLLFESDWSRSTTAFKEDETLVEHRATQLFYDYTIFSGNVLKIIRELQEGEVSPIVQLDSTKFAVVQIVKKYFSGDVPDYSLIKTSVQKLFLEEKKKVEIEKFIKQLYSNYDIEIVQ